MSVTHADLRQLLEPFPESDLGWLVMSYSEKTRKANIAPYVTARAVQSRLDDVCGPAGWQVQHQPITLGDKRGFLTGIGIHSASGWVWKWDGSPVSDFEAIKGGISGGFKRAAVCWGIGRYLYHLPRYWIPVQDSGPVLVRHRKENVGYCTPPKLPREALPQDHVKGTLAEREADWKERGGRFLIAVQAIRGCDGWTMVDLESFWRWAHQHAGLSSPHPSMMPHDQRTNFARWLAGQEGAKMIERYHDWLNTLEASHG